MANGSAAVDPAAVLKWYTILEVNDGDACRFTCVDVSASLVVLGTASGSIFYYARDTMRLLKVIGQEKEAIVSLKLSLNDTFLAYATSRNAICVVRLQLSRPTEKDRVVLRMSEHRAYVSNIVWSPMEDVFYSTDAEGYVRSTRVQGSLRSQLLPGFSSEVVLHCQSAIVQIDLDSEGDRLLVANMQRVVKLNLAATQNRLLQLGPDAFGRFGACFDRTHHDLRHCFVAAPGGLILRVDSRTGDLLTKISLPPFAPKAFVPPTATLPQHAFPQFSSLVMVGSLLLATGELGIALVDVEAERVISCHVDSSIPPQSTDASLNIRACPFRNLAVYVLHHQPAAKLFIGQIDILRTIRSLLEEGEAMVSRCIELAWSYQVLNKTLLKEIEDSAEVSAGVPEMTMRKLFALQQRAANPAKLVGAGGGAGAILASSNSRGESAQGGLVAPQDSSLIISGAAASSTTTTGAASAAASSSIGSADQVLVDEDPRETVEKQDKIVANDEAREEEDESESTPAANAAAREEEDDTLIGIPAKKPSVLKKKKKKKSTVAEIADALIPSAPLAPPEIPRDGKSISGGVGGVNSHDHNGNAVSISSKLGGLTFSQSIVAAISPASSALSSPSPNPALVAAQHLQEQQQEQIATAISSTSEGGKLVARALAQLRNMRASANPLRNITSSAASSSSSPSSSSLSILAAVPRSAREQQQQQQQQQYQQSADVSEEVAAHVQQFRAQMQQEQQQQQQQHQAAAATAATPSPSGENSVDAVIAATTAALAAAAANKHANIADSLAITYETKILATLTQGRVRSNLARSTAKVYALLNEQQQNYDSMILSSLFEDWLYQVESVGGSGSDLLSQIDRKAESWKILCKCARYCIWTRKDLYPTRENCNRFSIDSEALRAYRLVRHWVDSDDVIDAAIRFKWPETLAAVVKDWEESDIDEDNDDEETLLFSVRDIEILLANDPHHRPGAKDEDGEEEEEEEEDAMETLLAFPVVAQHAALAKFLFEASLYSSSSTSSSSSSSSIAATIKSTISKQWASLGSEICLRMELPLWIARLYLLGVPLTTRREQWPSTKVVSTSLLAPEDATGNSATNTTAAVSTTTVAVAPSLEIHSSIRDRYGKYLDRMIEWSPSIKIKDVSPNRWSETAATLTEWFAWCISSTAPNPDQVFVPPVWTRRWRKGAHNCHWERAEHLLAVIEIAERDVVDLNVLSANSAKDDDNNSSFINLDGVAREIDREALLMLCQRWGFVQGSIRLLIRLQRWREAVEIALASDTLDGLQRIGIAFGLEKDFWSVVIKVSQRANQEEEDIEISFAAVCNLLVNLVGPLFAIQVLSEAQVNVSSNFVRSLVAAAFQERSKMSEMNSLVETTTRSILQKIFEEEEAKIGAQWATMHSDRCAVCSLSLEEMIVYDGQEDLRESYDPETAIVFRCGHAFHAVCTPQQVCVLCWSKKIKTVVPLS